MVTASSEIYTLSLHDALPISPAESRAPGRPPQTEVVVRREVVHSHGVRARVEHRHRRRVRTHQRDREVASDRKSTRLNSSHSQISYAVFCLKKKMPSPQSRSE